MMKFLDRVKSKISTVDEVEEEATPQKELDPFDEYENTDDMFSKLLPTVKKKRTKIDEVVDVLQGDELRDVLDYLQIPADAEVPRDVLSTEDFSKVIFDEQAPVGYEEGQVDTFVNQARGSIEHYVKLLEAKNHHIALLATVVDKLQVSLNNLKVDQEITSGINIMATSNYEDLELRYQDALVKIREMEALLKGAPAASGPGHEELMEKLEQWRDAYSILQRENESLKEDNDELRTRCNYLEEQADDVAIDQPIAPIVPEDEEPLPLENFIVDDEPTLPVEIKKDDAAFYIPEDEDDDPFEAFMKESQ